MSVRIALLWPQTGSSWVAGGLYFENLLRSLALAGKTPETVIVEPVGGSFSQGPAICFPDVPVVSYVPPTSTSLWPRLRRAVRQQLEIPEPAFADALRRAGVDVAFGDMDFRLRPAVPWLAWIPDFQHVHYPEFFSDDELHLRDVVFSEEARRASAVLLSSNDARDDFLCFAPEFGDKARVAPFVSLIPDSILGRDTRVTVEKYRIADPFVVVPNQWWRHKNHRTAIQAAALLRDRGLDVKWVMTGTVADTRGSDHVSGLLQLIAELGVADRLVILGMLPREEQVDLIRAASMIVQPSLFEGWSTVVEDARTIGQRIVVSDIAVHREQHPPSSLFFVPQSPEDLAEKVEAMLRGARGRVDERNAIAASVQRGREFGQTFYEICLDSAQRRT